MSTVTEENKQQVREADTDKGTTNETPNEGNLFFCFFRGE